MDGISMVAFGWIILAIIVIIIFAFIASEFADVAVQKGYTHRKYFWICFLFAFAGYLLVIALPNLNKQGGENVVDGKKEIGINETNIINNTNTLSSDDLPDL